MPLIKSGSKEAFDKNFRELMKAGYSKQQSLAISYQQQRRYAKGKGWHGNSAGHSNARRK